MAVKITNSTERDLRLGEDVFITYETGQKVYLMDNDQVYSLLKQGTGWYAFYLLLTPLTLEVNNSEPFPIGYAIGPGLAGVNMMTSSNSNKRFQLDLIEYDINGSIIKSREIKYGLIGIRTDLYEALSVEVKE